MRTRFRIDIARELFKFSCAHMTVFPDGTKERLHGHNYYVGVTLALSDAGRSEFLVRRAMGSGTWIQVFAPENAGVTFTLEDD